MDNIPYLSTDQMVEVDRAMIEDYNILLIQMMENAGRNLAALARSRFLGGDPRGRDVVVLVGKGGSGGGGMVCARRLHNWGASVQVYTTAPVEDFSGVPAHQLDILKRMGISVTTEAGPADTHPDLIVDAIIGYSLKGNPRGRAGALISWANTSKAPVLSLDVPSGIDTATGEVHTPAVKADATMTLALPKNGLRGEAVKAQVGEAYLADISVPPALYGNRTLNLGVSAVFAREDIVRLW
ncbi:MAG: NAD(P)H-hydrate epimerase [Bacteroidota bacterium]